MKKVQITFTDEEVKILSDIAEKFGWRLSRYAKFILAREIAKELDGVTKAEYIADIKNEAAETRRARLIRQLQKSELDLWE